MVILWSDYFVYLLIIMVAIYGISVYRNPLTRPLWKQVIYRPLNMIALIIIGIYTIITLADSIHLHTSEKSAETNTSGIVSVLDLMLAPLPNRSEGTYSAPFALYGLSKETLLLPDGKVTRDFPRLQFGGAHLTDISQRNADLLRRISHAFLQSLILWGAICVIITLFASTQQKVTWDQFFKALIRGKTLFPWRTFLITLGIVLWCVITLWALIPHYHILGTDQIGDDVFYATLKSVRTGMIIGTVTTLVMLPFAVILGMMAGYFRGWVDDIIQYLYTTLSSVPGVLLIAAMVLALQMVMDRNTQWFETIMHRADARLLALCAILGITSWTGLCRLLRGETLKISKMDYIQAGHALGSSHTRLLVKHILPNLFHIILITLALDFSGLVLAEAVLSYVGVGVDPSSYSWGMMINTARLELAREPLVWWNLTAAFIFMFILVLAANIFADALRDAFDPRKAFEGAH